MTSVVPASAVPMVSGATGAGADGGPASTAGADGGVSGGCFDVVACLTSAAPATVDPANCTVSLPSGASAASVNVALQFPIGGAGVCGVDACWVVLTDWTLAGTQIELPSAACTMAASQGARLVISTTCATQPDTVPSAGPGPRP